jgi:SRSO17 transposase
VENCQVAVYLGYATTTGYTLIDHALYLPKVWIADPDRMAEAGVPAGTEFATKPALAQQMLTRTLAAGVQASWVAADEVYGNTGTLRRHLAAQHLGYVLAIAKTHPITTGIGTRHAVDYAVRPDLRWHRISAGPGLRGPRVYDWAWIEVTDPALTDSDTGEKLTGQNWLLIRRHPTSGELAFYRAHADGPVALKTLVTVAGTRWRIEDSFAGTKELAALDHHQVRTWTAWHRWSLLAMIAHAILAVLTTRQDPPAPGLIRLTRHEIRHLLVELTRTLHPPLHLLAWSIWRRAHQATAQECHQRRAAAAATQNA